MATKHSDLLRVAEGSALWPRRPRHVETALDWTGHQGHDWNLISEMAMFLIPKQSSTIHRLWTAGLRDLQTSECHFHYNIPHFLFLGHMEKMTRLQRVCRVCSENTTNPPEQLRADLKPVKPCRATQRRA